MKHITAPAIIEAVGKQPKRIEEFIGRVNSGDTAISIAKMTSPEGWEEPGQTPEFDEHTLVLTGCLRVKTIMGIFDVREGEAISTKAGEWVQYSSPHPGGATYIATCTPAFSPELVHRDPVLDMKNLSDNEAEQLASQLRKPTGKEGRQLAAWLNEGNSFVTKQAYETLSTLSTGNCLEIGFGNGFYLHELLEFNDHVEGVDFSQDMVDLAHQIQQQHIESGDITVSCQDAAQLSFEPNTFDQIVGVNTLYFWDDASAVLTEIKRVLKPGGHLVLGIRPKGAAGAMKFTNYGFTLYTEEEAVTLLEQCGFQQVSAKTSPDHFLESTIIQAQKPV